MRELSLFSGAGGGLLGTKLLGWTTIGYVEYEKYCQKILKQRIQDGILDAAPIFGDIKNFISEGFAAEYRGYTDIISAGFPCQPFSVAGQQKGEADERNMWPQTKDCISIIRPRFCFLENVPGLLANGYIQRIFGDLAELGYNARWGVVGADDVGAPHRRKRLWIVADSQGAGQRSGVQGQGEQLERTEQRGNPSQCGEEVADTKQNGLQRGKSAEGAQTNLRRRFTEQGITWWDTDPADIPDTMFNGCDRKEGNEAEQSGNGQENGLSERGQKMHRGPIKPLVGRVAHGVAHRVDRLKAIGNGQVPAVVRAAWQILNNP